MNCSHCHAHIPERPPSAYIQALRTTSPIVAEFMRQHDHHATPYVKVLEQMVIELARASSLSMDELTRLIREAPMPPIVFAMPTDPIIESTTNGDDHARTQAPEL